MTDLGPVLSRLGLSQYLKSFVDEGFDTWETVLEITESDLDVLNVKLGHRRRLQREISDTRRLLAEEVAVSPSRTTPYEEINDDTSSVGRLEHLHSGGSGKRKYRRHPKPDENAPERPPSAYVIFSNKTREDLKPRNLSFTEIAKRVGENWQVLGPDEKEPYETQAARAKERYNSELAKYKKTDSYRDYCQYLTDFKVKHATSLPEGKRPKLQSEPSASTSSASTNGAHDGSASSGSAIAHRRRRVDSASSIGQYSIPSGHPSPAGVPPSAMIGIPIARTGTLSPVPTSPPPPAPCREVMSHTPMSTAQLYATSEDATHDINHGLHSGSHALPRSFPVEEHDPNITQGKLPPLLTDPSSTGGRKDLPHSSARRTHHIPPSLVHQDTSRSSPTSRLSLSTQSFYGVYNPMTPVEESQGQRSLPAPQSMPMTSPFGGKMVDRTQTQPLQPHTSTLLPSSYTPLYPLQPQYYSPPGSSGTEISFTELPIVYPFPITSLRSIAHLKDIPQERHSLKNLSLAGSPCIHPEPPHNLRSRSRDLAGMPERNHHPPQLASSHSPHSSQHGQANSPPESRRSLLCEDSSSDTYLDSPTTADPLSVLAYAGKLVDRDSRRSPRSPQ